MTVLVNNMQEKMVITEDMMDLVIKVAETALHGSDVGENAEVSIVFVDDDYIAQLNKQYRGIEGPTDVLSFAMLEGEQVPDSSPAVTLGDVVISLETAANQGEEYGHGLARELAYLTIHGVLHLLGYDHGTDPDKVVMRNREEEILGKTLG